MYAQPDDLPADGWLSFGDPGDFPAVEADPGCCCSDGCTGTAPAGFGPAVDGPATTAAGPDLTGWVVPGVARPAAGPHPLLGGLSRAVDALAGHGPLSGSRVDTAELLRLVERARSLALRELAEMDATGGHQRPGMHPTTAAAWLRDTRLLTDSAARSAVRLAGELRDVFPQVAELLADGRITVEHAAAIAGGVRGLDPDVIRQAGGALAALALATDPTDVRKRLRDRATAVDDRLAADAQRKARDRQHLSLAQVGGHTAVGGTLAGDDGALVRLAMALAVEEARTDGDTRSLTARQADILIRWATEDLQRRSAGDSLANDAHTVRSHLLMNCTPDQFTSASTTEPGDDPQATTPSLTGLVEADLAGAAPVSPTIVGTHHPLSRASLRRLGCDATITLVLRRTPGADSCPAGCPIRAGKVCEHLAQPLYVGRSTRTVSGLQFKALVVRDRKCVVRGCHRPPAQCAAHHVQHWADGGPTDLDNLVLLCHQHHHDLHDRGRDLPHHDGLRYLTQTGWGRAPS